MIPSGHQGQPEIIEKARASRSHGAEVIQLVGPNSSTHFEATGRERLFQRIPYTPTRSKGLKPSGGDC